MALLGLELNDAGIMVAGGRPAALLEVDGHAQESPGFALSENNLLLVGTAAQKAARLNPRSYSDRFWDELGTDSLKHPAFEGQNNAELAYAHLARVWETIREYGDELVIAVPGFYKQKQLGLILGIANELAIPVGGFATTAIAASAKPYPKHLLFHLDIHLHRIEITFLEQRDQLLQRNLTALPGNGLNNLYAAWVRAIADEFVRTTRFDPFDRAGYEQELYDRLPSVLQELQGRPSLIFEIKAKSQTYQVNITRDLVVQESRGVYREICRLIQEMRENFAKPQMPLVLEVTHRVSSLPGYRAELSNIPNVHIIELEPGAGALGVLELQRLFVTQKTGRGVAFVTNRPWQTAHVSRDAAMVAAPGDLTRPTHVRYGNLAYPIAAKPLVIGRGPAQNVSIGIHDHVQGVSSRHCTVQLSGDQVLLFDHSTNGTFVDGVKVSGSAVLKIGQIIRVGTPGEELQLIACLESDET